MVGLPTWHMRNVRSLMELGSDSVPHVFVDHAKPILFVSVIHDRFTNDRHLATGRRRTDTKVQRIKSTLRYRTSRFRNVAGFADKKSFRLVAMPTVDDRRQVNVCNVTRLQFLLVRDPVADHIVDTDATTFGERHPIPRIAKTRGRVAVVLSELVDKAINFNRFDAGPHNRSDLVHQPSIKLPRRPHLLLLVVI